MIFGPIGIFVGKLMSDVFYWIRRTLLINDICFHKDKSKLNKICQYNLLYLLSFVFLCTIGIYIVGFVNYDNKFMQFIVRGLIVESIIMVFIFAFWKDNSRFLFLKKYLTVIKKEKQ